MLLPLNLCTEYLDVIEIYGCFKEQQRDPLIFLTAEAQRQCNYTEIVHIVHDMEKCNNYKNLINEIVQ